MKERFDILSALCSKATTKLYSTSFSLGIYYLGVELRQPIYNIYGFVRLADEIVDSFHDYDKSLLLAEFRQDTFTAIERGISVNPILNAFQRTVNEYGIKHELINLFLKSMEMDLKLQVYTTDKYDEYILGSAQVVGLMCLQVFTGGNEQEYDRLKESAMLLGSAFQKVNFLRDLRADYMDLSRSYFPQVDLANFTNRDKFLIEQEIKNEFRGALKGIRELPRSSKKGVYLAYVYYNKLFLKITYQSAEKVMSERIRVSNSRKFLLMFDSLIRYKLNVL
ncbi:phytoene/squalene synthase family protein [Mucilaginibacter flavus]|uniref:phytoene/squalene synthase family protein n=1 Tax=Mucilaginibacter flavus TaxID=931504 RepID=UPI0025B4C338|nr:phytoene/squalene synthase family protein [Mucilaginibacter flavus]MDN3584574.1 phytoene/squalene synthase family protein [Mucilaginibacter flavus]